MFTLAYTDVAAKLVMVDYDYLQMVLAHLATLSIRTSAGH